MATRALGMKTYGVGGDVGEVGSDTGSVDDIVQGELINQRAELEEEGQGLLSSQGVG